LTPSRGHLPLQASFVWFTDPARPCFTGASLKPDPDLPPSHLASLLATLFVAIGSHALLVPCGPASHGLT